MIALAIQVFGELVHFGLKPRFLAFKLFKLDQQFVTWAKALTTSFCFVSFNRSSSSSLGLTRYYAPPSLEKAIVRLRFFCIHLQTPIVWNPGTMCSKADCVMNARKSLGHHGPSLARCGGLDDVWLLVLCNCAPYAVKLPCAQNCKDRGLHRTPRAADESAWHIKESFEAATAGSARLHDRACGGPRDH